MGGWLAIVIIIAALVGGYFFYQNSYSNSTVPVNTNTTDVESAN